MLRDRLRLQVALYLRSKYLGSYHYALFVAPKLSKDLTPTIKHHVKNTFMNVAGEVTDPWRYECTTNTQVEQIVIAKVAATREDIDQILESVPVYQTDELDENGVKLFSCRTWVRDALDLLANRDAISAFTSWNEIERKSREYVGTKQRQRRWSSSWTGPPGVSLMDSLDQRAELVQ
ncbi:hypothetical protein DOTSEDRAFT_139532 [Dothistroma septosporum NZE10]|uniref:Uncharacterized protein n=1 Tax=Dothistroma septosporum (strain NZE10 / CBS 128990) TaxID=675120 RepID=M2YIB3_DOTSN|nr:hypothetical protein DOTSEDRAFT_139532 [Dothistroma septosporum NZE10]